MMTFIYGIIIIIKGSDRVSKKFLKLNSLFLIIIGVILLVLSTIYMFYTISTPSEPNSWDDLGKFFIVIGTIIVYILSSPLVISGIGTLHYLKEKNNYKLCIIFNIIGIILYGVFIFLFIYSDVLNIFSDYYNGNVNVGLKIILTIIISFIFVCPLFANTIILYKEKNDLSYKNLWNRYRIIIIGIIAFILILVCYNMFKLSIINTKKIEVTENNVYSYSDFESQLKSRNLMYKLPAGKSELTSPKEISALDSSSKYGYRFSTGSYTDSYMLSINTDRKFPMFVYDSYTSLIKKSSKTASYYYIGPEDWYINWYIYYVNGKIYAAIGDESEYGSGWETSLSTTKYGVVVSEEDEIITYNSQKNYYVKGGGIIDTNSGTQRSEFPTTSDLYNKKCMKIRVVDKINAKTLDRIAKELSPQYWKEYKK